jgi:Fur family transcriptional regulator, stress-responsive regulator
LTALEQTWVVSFLHSFVFICTFAGVTMDKPISPTRSVADELRDADLRVTAARVAILETVRAGDHLDVETIAVGARRRVGHVSTQAVYEALHALSSAGLVQRIEPEGSPARFEGRVGDNHHHLVCRRCGKITDVDCAVGHTPCLEPISSAGYLVDQADVTYWGVCPECRAVAAESEEF